MANFEPAIEPKGTPRRRFTLRQQESYQKFRDALDRLQDGGEYCSRGEVEAAANPGLNLVKLPME